MRWQAGAAGALIYWSIDAGLCYAALLAGVPVNSAQVMSFSVAAILDYWCRVRPGILTVAGSARATLLCLLTVSALLALFLRSGLIELLLRGWALPVYAAVALTVIASGLVTQMGVRLCLATAPTGAGVDVPWRTLAIGVVGYAFLLRLVYGAQIELMPEEAYYWNYSRHLDIGYLDHPPLVAWLIRLGTGVFGDTEFGVRFGAFCSGGIASFFLFRLTRDLFGDASGLLVLVLAQALPFFFFSGMLMTPDAPLTAAWAASLYFSQRALLAGRSSAWLWAGLSLGVGLLAKYTIGLVGFAVFMFVLLDAPSRRWLRRWEPYAAVLIAVGVFAPVIVWNARHEWASFAFQTSRRLAEHPRFALPALIGGAILLITPTGLAAVAAAFLRGRPQCSPAGAIPAQTMTHAWRFLQLTLFAPLTVFLVFSLRHEIKLDWTGAPWVAALPVMAFGIAESLQRSNANPGGWLRWAWPPTVMGMLLIYGAGFFYLVIGIPGVGYSKHMELIPVGWRDFGRQIDGIAADVRKKYGADSLVVGMDRYAIASELAFYSSDRSRSVAQTSTGHLFGNMGLMYEQWFPAQLQAGRTLLLVAWDAEELAAGRLQGHVDEMDPVREGVLVRNGKVVRRYYVRVAHGYR